MIFQPARDSEYHQWFAWRPVKLYGPDEWERHGLLPRWVWLRTVYRMRGWPRTYYVLPASSQVTSKEL